MFDSSTVWHTWYGTAWQSKVCSQVLTDVYHVWHTWYGTAWQSKVCSQVLTDVYHVWHTWYGTAWQSKVCSQVLTDVYHVDAVVETTFNYITVETAECTEADSQRKTWRLGRRVSRLSECRNEALLSVHDSSPKHTTSWLQDTPVTVARQLPVYNTDGQPAQPNASVHTSYCDDTV